MSIKSKAALANILAISALCNSSYMWGENYRLGRGYSPTKCKDVSDIPGNYHSGIYSKQKKLRKGAGKKKLTRAQRKKLNGGFKK